MKNFFGFTPGRPVPGQDPCSFSEGGATTIEYGLLAAFIAIAVVTVVAQLTAPKPLPEESIRLLAPAANDLHEAEVELRAEAQQACTDAGRKDGGCVDEAVSAALKTISE